MKKVKTAELMGSSLDWAVAKCECMSNLDERVTPEGVRWAGGLFQPSKHWSEGGPIIEREHITLGWTVSNYLHVTGCWSGYIPQTNGKILYATTPLIAAMRCYVAAKMGDIIEIPEELLT